MATMSGDTFVLSRSDVVEALASVYAAAELFLYDVDDERFEFPCDDDRCDAVTALHVALCKRFGHVPGDAYTTDPLELEILARAQEIEADLIEAVLKERARRAERRSSPRAARLRAYAARLREPGADLDNVVFPSVSEAVTS